MHSFFPQTEIEKKNYTYKHSMQQEVKVGTPLYFDPMVHNEIGQEDNCNVTPEKQKMYVDLEELHLFFLFFLL